MSRYWLTGLFWPPHSIAGASVEHSWLSAEGKALLTLNGTGTILQLRSPMFTCLYSIHRILHVGAKLVGDMHFKATLRRIRLVVVGHVEHLVLTPSEHLA